MYVYQLIGAYVFSLTCLFMIFFRMESSNRIQSLSSFETKSFLVDSSKARRKIVEFEQLPNWHDSSSRWCWRHLRTHLVQGRLNLLIIYHFRLGAIHKRRRSIFSDFVTPSPFEETSFMDGSLLFCIVQLENLFEILFCLYWSW